MKTWNKSHCSTQQNTLHAVANHAKVSLAHSSYKHQKVPRFSRYFRLVTMFLPYAFIPKTTIRTNLDIFLLPKKVLIENVYFHFHRNLYQCEFQENSTFHMFVAVKRTVDITWTVHETFVIWKQEGYNQRKWHCYQSKVLTEMSRWKLLR